MLVDLERNEVVELLPKRDKSYLINYFNKLGGLFCAQIEVFCSDMWEGYLNMAKQLFKKATIITDRFHVFAHVQKGVDNCRKSLRRKYKDNDLLKGLKWTLLKNEQQLTSKEKQQLEQVFKDENFSLLQLTYQAKNTFRAIFQGKHSKKEAEKLLDDWKQTVESCKIRHLFHFLKTFDKWKDYICNYFECRKTTSPVEGINNKIKAIKRRAFGYLCFDNFRRKVLIDFLD